MFELHHLAPVSFTLCLSFSSFFLLFPAPEVLMASKSDGYSAAVDWWSVGITMYEFVTGKVSTCLHFTESSECVCVCHSLCMVKMQTCH